MKTREFSRIFYCGKTQIGKIIKNKDSILSMYEANVSQIAKHDSKISRISEYAEINKALYMSPLPVLRTYILGGHR